MTNPNHAMQQMLDKEARRANTHGVVLRVQSGDGRIDFRGAAGAATPGARICIASITKMFTAVLVMQLVAEGRLSLETPVQALLPEHDLTDLHDLGGVHYGPGLTLRQLLHQTSGLADYFEGGLIHDLRRGEDRGFDLHDVLEMTRPQRPRAVPDSGRAYYSDTNYQLLGAAIAATTGQSFAQDVEERICAPLGLSETRVADEAAFTGERAPLPIYQKAQPLKLARALTSMGADGSIISTNDDLMAFLRAHISGALLTEAQRGAMREWKPLFFPFHYGFGLMRFQLPRWMSPFRPSPVLIGHSGASGAFAFHAPEQDIFLTGTFNQLDAPRRPFGFMLRVLRVLEREGGRA